MYLTSYELEAIARCKASGLIPVETKTPENEGAYRDLITQLGILYCEKFVCRDKQGNLRICKVVSPDKATMSRKIAFFAKKSPEILTSLLISVQDAQTSFSIEAWYIFFEQGKELIDINEFNSRIATGCRKELTIEQLEKGFDLKYEAQPGRCTASRRQLDVLAEMIVSGRLEPIPQREWENLTKTRATELISSVPAPRKEKKTLSPKVKKILTLYKELTKEEKIILIEKLQTTEED